MTKVHQLARTLKQLRPFRLRVVERKGNVPCGQTHWTEPPTIEIRKGTRFGERNALLHEFAHVVSRQTSHTELFYVVLVGLTKFYGVYSRYPWKRELQHLRRG